MLLACSTTGKHKEHAANASSAKKNGEDAKIATLNLQDKEKYDEIKQLIINEDFPKAEANLRNFLLKYPNFSGAWANLGVVYSETERLDQAEKALQKAIELDDSIAPVYARLAYVYRIQGKIQEAVGAYEKSLEKNPQYASAHYNLALLYDLYLQEPEKALLHLKAYINITGAKEKDAETWLKQVEKSAAGANAGGTASAADQQVPLEAASPKPTVAPQ